MCILSTSSHLLQSPTTSIAYRLCVVCRGRDVSSSSGPVDVDILALGVRLVGVFRLDPEGVGTEVVTLSLQQVGGQVLGAVTVVEAQCSAERGRGNTPQSTLGDDTVPVSNAGQV
jgi:hypothetical protein